MATKEAIGVMQEEAMTRIRQAAQQLPGESLALPAPTRDPAYDHAQTLLAFAGYLEQFVTGGTVPTKQNIIDRQKAVTAALEDTLKGMGVDVDLPTESRDPQLLMLKQLEAVSDALAKLNQPPVPPALPDFDAMLKDDVKAFADSIGVEYRSDDTKAEIIAAIETEVNG